MFEKDNYNEQLVYDTLENVKTDLREKNGNQVPIVVGVNKVSLIVAHACNINCCSAMTNTQLISPTSLSYIPLLVLSITFIFLLRMDGMLMPQYNA